MGALALVALPQDLGGEEGSKSNETPEDTFDYFWALYARHEAKKDARKAWASLTDAEQVAAVVAALDWRRVWQAQGRPVDKMPLAGTWIRGERWEDELPQGYRRPEPKPKPPNGAAEPEPVRGKVEIPEYVRQAFAKLKEGR